MGFSASHHSFVQKNATDQLAKRSRGGLQVDDHSDRGDNNRVHSYLLLLDGRNPQFENHTPRTDSILDGGNRLESSA